MAWIFQNPSTLFLIGLCSALVASLIYVNISEHRRRSRMSEQERREHDRQVETDLSVW